MWEESLVENMTIFIKKRNKNCICQINERLTKNKPRDIKKCKNQEVKNLQRKIISFFQFQLHLKASLSDVLTNAHSVDRLCLW